MEGKGGQFIKGSSQKRAISLRPKASFLDAPRGFSRASRSERQWRGNVCFKRIVWYD